MLNHPVAALRKIDVGDAILEARALESLAALIVKQHHVRDQLHASTRGRIFFHSLESVFPYICTLLLAFGKAPDDLQHFRLQLA